MVDRLVIGSGSLVHTVANSLHGQHGTVQVVTDDGRRASTLRESGISVEHLDATDATALAALTADVVAVFGQTYAENVAVARAARRAFPDAHLLAYAGLDADEDDGTLSTVADAVIDPGTELAGYVLTRLGDAGRRTRQLRAVLRDIDRLAVVCHDNPDPDAIASGVALARLARAVGSEAQVCYFGDITHQENRAFVNVLDFDLRNLDPDEDRSEFDGLALVDHSRPGVNDQLPADSDIAVVIDHHPPLAPVDARFVDLRSGVGATSTLLVDYLTQFGVELDDVVSTALLFGIHVDTKSFSREVSQADFEAAATLVQTADLGVLKRIESPSVTGSTIDTIASAIRNRRVEGTVLLSCVGNLAERDALAQAADRLLTIEDISTTMVYGVMDGTIYVSARSRGRTVDIGETLRDAFGKIGSAGGHVDMAGAQITLGVLDAVDEREESLQEIVEAVVADRFLDAIEANAGHAVTSLYPTNPDDDDRYFAAESDSVTDMPADDETSVPSDFSDETSVPSDFSDETSVPSDFSDETSVPSDFSDEKLSSDTEDEPTGVSGDQAESESGSDPDTSE